MAKKASGRIGNLGSWAHPPKGKAAKPVVARSGTNSSPLGKASLSSTGQDKTGSNSAAGSARTPGSTMQSFGSATTPGSSVRSPKVYAVTVDKTKTRTPR